MNEKEAVIYNDDTVARMLLTLRSLNKRVSRLEIENAAFKKGVASMSLDTEILVKRRILETNFHYASKYGKGEDDD